VFVHQIGHTIPPAIKEGGKKNLPTNSAKKKGQRPPEERENSIYPAGGNKKREKEGVVVALTSTCGEGKEKNSKKRGVARVLPL